MNADHVDGRSPAAGVLGGVSLKPWLDIEGEIVIPTRDFTRIYGGDVVSYSFATLAVRPSAPTWPSP